MKLFEDSNNEDIRMHLNSIIRVGKVSSINPAKATAKVLFYDERDGDDNILVSYDLQVLQRNAWRDRDYAMPDKGEDVLCLFLPFGLVDGFILGSVYAGRNMPPESTEDKRTVVFDDKTRVSYDRSLHRFDANFSDGTNMSYDGTTHHMNIEIEGTKITANRGFVTIDAPRNVSITAGNAVTVKANKLKVEGSLGASGGASGVISAASIATVQDGIITAIS